MNDGMMTGPRYLIASRRARWLLVTAVICIVFGGYRLFQAKATVLRPGIKTMDARELSQFDGTDPDKPIYLALDGFVYDISSGKPYYVAGGTYHFLAGKDSSKELHIAGAGIIKRKYPVIAAFTQ